MSYALFLHQYGYHCYNFEILKLILSYYLTICSTDESGISRYVGTAGQGLHINISLRDPGYLKTIHGRENLPGSFSECCPQHSHTFWSTTPSGERSHRGEFYCWGCQVRAFWTLGLWIRRISPRSCRPVITETITCHHLLSSRVSMRSRNSWELFLSEFVSVPVTLTWRHWC